MIGQTTVGAVSTEVVARNPMRNVLYLSNDSDEAIYLAIGEAAVLGQGIALQAGQDDVQIPFKLQDGDPGLREQINAICASGQKNLAWLAL